MNAVDRKTFWQIEQQMQLLDALLIRAVLESNLEQAEQKWLDAFGQYQKIRKKYYDYIADNIGGDNKNN